MTAKQYKLMCRIKAVKLTRFLTWMIQMLILIAVEYFPIPISITAAISITLWIYGPCYIMWVLEHIYNINHDEVSYK